MYKFILTPSRKENKITHVIYWSPANSRPRSAEPNPRLQKRSFPHPQHKNILIQHRDDRLRIESQFFPCATPLAFANLPHTVRRTAPRNALNAPGNAVNVPINTFDAPGNSAQTRTDFQKHRKIPPYLGSFCRTPPRRRNVPTHRQAGRWGSLRRHVINLPNRRHNPRLCPGCQ
jgi:hypothetical protein